MRYIALLFSAIVVLCSCETTGDPHKGGVFWSEDKAKQRLEEKRRQLRQIEADTNRIEQENRQLKKENEGGGD
jgi:hypothetical protein